MNRYRLIALLGTALLLPASHAEPGYDVDIPIKQVVPKPPAPTGPSAAGKQAKKEAKAQAVRERLAREKADAAKALKAAQAQSAKGQVEIAQLTAALLAKPAPAQPVQTPVPTHSSSAVPTSAAALVVPPPTSATAPIDLDVRPAFPGGPAMVTLPVRPKGFLMGSKEYDNEKDSQGGPHHVTIDYRLEMGQTEVNVAQYLQCVTEKACSEPEWREAGNQYPNNGRDKQFGAAVTGANQPIVGVSWHKAQQYANWVNQKAGLAHLPANDPRRYRLPSEAEWEYAARADSIARWSHGDDAAKLRQYAWYSANSGGKAHAVATRDANKWKLFDMAGNVWEWVQDCYQWKYQNAPTNGAAAGRPDDASCGHVLRGGSFDGGVEDAQSASRLNSAIGYRLNFIGFRLARTLLP